MICQTKKQKVMRKIENTYAERSQYDNGMDAVRMFFATVNDTIVEHLRRNGDIEIPEIHRERWAFPDENGPLSIDAVRLTEDRNDFYLDCTDIDGEAYCMELGSDIVMIDYIMDIIYNGFGEEDAE